MRFQTLVILVTLAGSNVLPVFSQPARSGDDDQLTEILRRKQAELDAQGRSPSRSRAISPEPARPAPEVRQTIAPTSPSRSSVAASYVPNTADDDKLSQALRRKQAELDALSRGNASRPAPAMETTQPIETRKTNVAPESRTVETSKPIATIPRQVGSPSDDPLTEALRRKQAELDTQAGVSSARESGSGITWEENAARSNGKSRTRKTAAPETGWPEPAIDLTSKEGRLADLLRRYRADEITPQDYHMQRAKIVAEP